MKKEVTTCELLGLSQLEISLLLKINRSQWSMYESGKRNLPLQAMQQLNAMLQYVVNENNKQTKKPLLSTQQQDKKKAILKALIQENEYQQQLTARKIEKIKKSRTFVAARFQLLDFLNNQTHLKEENPDLLKSMEAKARNKAGKYDESLLMAYEIKQTLLQEEEKRLKSYLDERYLNNSSS